jgi:hypothetical protein
MCNKAQSTSRPPPNATQTCGSVLRLVLCESGAGPVTKLLQCAQCKRVWYCFKEHQLLHWKLAHKTSCKALQQAASIEQGTGGSVEGASAGVMGSKEQGGEGGSWQEQGQKEEEAVAGAEEEGTGCGYAVVPGPPVWAGYHCV